MTTNKARIAKLEQAQGAGEKVKYYCVSYPEAKNYKAEPIGGGAGEKFTFETQEAMTAFFDKHLEFELLHVQIFYASQDTDGKE